MADCLHSLAGLETTYQRCKREEQESAMALPAHHQRKDYRRWKKHHYETDKRSTKPLLSIDKDGVEEKGCKKNSLDPFLSRRNFDLSKLITHGYWPRRQFWCNDDNSREKIRDLTSRWRELELAKVDAGKSEFNSMDR